MKTVKPIDENELMELMAGKQPTPAPAIATEKTPQKPAPTKKKKAELYEYESYFFEQGETSAREGKSVYIRPEFHQRIARIVQVIGEDKISLYNYLDNVLKAHFEQYQEEITQSFEQKYKPIF
mgnify:CR=1 FL=1